MSSREVNNSSSAKVSGGVGGGGGGQANHIGASSYSINDALASSNPSALQKRRATRSLGRNSSVAEKKTTTGESSAYRRSVNWLETVVEWLYGISVKVYGVYDRAHKTSWYMGLFTLAQIVKREEKEE